MNTGVVSRAALLVAVLVVTAGCAAMPDTGSPTASTATAEPDTTNTPATTDGPVVTATRTSDDLDGRPAVVGGSLPFDVNATFARLEQLLGVDAVQPTVRVGDEASFSDYTIRDSAFELLGVANGSASASPLSVSGSSSARRVSLGFSDAPASVVEGVLVHEFAHSIQAQRGLLSRDLPSSFDAREAWKAVVEGGAVYASTAYVERYDVGSRNWTAFFGRLYHEGPDGNRYAASTSYFGARYYDAVLEDPSGFASVPADPPNTTAAILHPDEGAGEPAALSVAATASDGWSAAGTDRYGELFTRFVLSTELSADRAARAAAGWRDDALVEFDRDGDRALAWVHRWDDASDADEFAAAFGAYAEDGAAPGADVRVARVNETTTAAFVGPPGFVANASATVENDSVVVAGG